MLQLPLLRDIQLATGNAPCRSIVPNRGGAYHGNATKHREQSEVEGIHASVEVCRIVRRLNAKDKNGLFTRLGGEKEFLYGKAERAWRGVKTREILCWRIGQHRKPDHFYI